MTDISDFRPYYSHAKQRMGIRYATSEFLYPSSGPWPRPSFDYPFGQAPEIDNIPPQENADWARYVGSYYTGNMTRFGNDGAHFAVESLFKNGIRGYASIDDPTFDRLVSEGLYSKFLCELDADDRELFKGHLSGDPGNYLKSDYSCMRVVEKTWPGEHAAPTIALLEKQPGSSPSPCTVVAIAIAGKQPDGHYGPYDVILTPADRDSWWLAKYFVLQGAIHRINLIDHVKVHFPSDAINAVTKTVLPRWHLVQKLLLPHLWLTMPVNNSVLEGERSLINRNTWYPWSPFVAKGDEVRRLFPFSWAGAGYYDSLPPNPAFPPYEFTLRPEGLVYQTSSYGAFVSDYYAPLLDFTRNVVAAMSPDRDNSIEWLEIRHWAYHIASFVPGFPDQNAIAEGDNLAAALAMVIWNGAVLHSGDHTTLHKMMCEDPVPFVLRVPPPGSATTSPTDDLGDALGDKGREFLANVVHHVVGGLADKVINAALKDVPFHDEIEKAISAALEHSEDEFLGEILRDETFKSSALPLCWPTDLVYAKMADLLFYMPHNSSLLAECMTKGDPHAYRFEDSDDKLRAAWQSSGRPVIEPDGKSSRTLHEHMGTCLSALEAVEQKHLDVRDKLGFPRLHPGGNDLQGSRVTDCIGAGVQY